MIALLLACRPPDPTPTEGGSPPTAATGHTGAPAHSAAPTGETGAPSPRPLRFDEGAALVVPDGDGLTLFDRDGAEVWARTWTEIAGPCDACGGEGATADGDGLLLAFTTLGVTSGGAVARLDGDGALDWRVDGFGFPHDAVRDPADDAVIVVETAGSRLRWIPGDGSTDEALRALDGVVPGWPGGLPNGAERIDDDGVPYLLLSHRGLGEPRPGTTPANGFLSLWDLSDPTAPALVWRFPAVGGLGSPHGAVVREHDGHRWLVWAHSDGLWLGGTVGLAWLDDLRAGPVYVADLQPAGAEAPFEFLRGAELTDDGELWLTDSGPGGGASTQPTGRVLRAELPAGLGPAVESGAWGDQRLVTLEPVRVASGLVNPFEGWIWQAPFPGAAR